MYIFDQVSDVIFAVHVFQTHQYNNKFFPDENPYLTMQLYVGIASISLIVIPILVTLAQLNRAIVQHWVGDLFCGNSLRIWLATHSKKLYAISILTGSSFAAIQFFNVY